MQTSKTLSWSELLAALRAASAQSVVIRDGRETEPAGTIGTRSAAKGTELCLFEGDTAVARPDLIERLEALAKNSGRRFMTSARARVNDAVLLIDGVSDETIDDVLCTVINTRRPVLGFNQSQQTGSRTHLRSKRIKNF